MTSDDPAKLKATATYDAAADHFDDVPLSFWDRYGRLTVERLQLPAGVSVLDVGCGTGASALPAARSVGPTGKVIGVDLAENLLVRARAKASAQSLQNVEFRRADMDALDFPDATFDAIISVFSIFFVPDMVRLARDLWRMLRPRGRLAVTTWGPRMFEPGSTIWWTSVGRVRPDLVPTVNPWERITTPEAIANLMRDAKIENPEIVSMRGEQELASPEDWWTVVLGSGYRWTVDQMQPEEVEQVRTASLGALRRQETRAIETNVLFAIATKA